MLSALLVLLGVCAVIASAEVPDQDGKYPLWIGDKQVTEENKDQIAFEEGFAKYVSETNTLILNNISKKNEDEMGEKDPDVEDPLYYLQYMGTDDDLNIELVGTNYIDCQNCGFFSSDQGVVFKGSGTLTVNCIGPGSGFTVHGDCMIKEECTIYACVKQGVGFQTNGDFTCNGTATVTSGTNLVTEGVSSSGKILITGTFSAEEITGYGIQVCGPEGMVEIKGGTVSANGILVEEGTLTISDGSVVEANANFQETAGSSNPLYGICAAKGITITDSTVTATSDMTTAIHCENPASSSAAIIIDNSTVVAKSIPKAEETKCPGKGIFNKEGTVSLKDSDVTAEGTDGIYTEWGEVIIDGGTVAVDGKETESSISGYGIYVGYDNLTLTDATLTANGLLAGIIVSMGSYIQNGGELNCHGGLFAPKSIDILPDASTQAEPKVTIEAAEGAQSAVSSWSLHIVAGTVSVQGGDYGVIIDSVDPNSEGLKVENAITKVVIEGTTQAALLCHDDADKIIILGDELIIREPENGTVSEDKHDFLDANSAAAKKVILVKSYGITFVANGGDGTMTASSADSGSEYKLPACGFTAPEWQVFDGWLVGNEKYAAGDKIAVTADTVLTAQWKHVHSPTLVEEQAATCTVDGHAAYYTCPGCDLWFEDAEGETEITDHSSVIIPAGHTEVIDPAIPATCTDTGLTEGKHCSACDTVLVAQQTVPALGHEWGDWVVTTEATVEQAGVETRVCNHNPAHKETRPIPQIPVEFSFVSGTNSEYTPGSGTALSFTIHCSADNVSLANHLTGAKMDGENLVSGEDFSIEGESNIIRLKPDYLDTLPAGTHTLTAVLDNTEEINAEFKVMENATEEDSETAGAGDPSMLPLWISLLAVSMMAMAAQIVARKRKQF